MNLLSRKMGIALTFLFLLGISNRIFGQEDVADISSRTMAIKVDKEDASYTLIGEPKRKESKELGLAVILPGGSGRTSDFLSFIKRIYKFVLMDRGYIVALPDAAHGNTDIVWPTKSSKIKDLKYTTEKYVDAILKDVLRKCKIDSKRIVMMAWSSGGPAAYEISYSQKKISGFYILMSVFKKVSGSKRKGAKGKVYYIEHSPEDKKCPFRLTGVAKKDLEKSGGKVTIAEYEGGHGFPMPVYPRMKKAFLWLEEEITSGKRK